MVKMNWYHLCDSAKDLKKLINSNILYNIKLINAYIIGHYCNISAPRFASILSQF